MQNILALDISSNTIGWGLLSYDDIDIKLLRHGHLKPPNKQKANGSMSRRLNFAYQEIKKLIQDTEPDVVVVEDYVRRFRRGKSNANTIILLAAFNEICSLVAFRYLDKDVERISVNNARAEVGSSFSKKVEDKDDVFDLIVQKFPTFVPLYNRNGNIKKESQDETDAILVGLSYILKCRE